MRLGKLELAFEDLQSAGKVQDESWLHYLGALHLAFEGRRAEFVARIDQMIQSNAFGDDSLLAYRANRILLAAASGKIEEAQRVLNGLIEANEFDYLRYNTIAELDDLAAALPGVPAISKFCSDAKKALWPEGCGIDFERDERFEALKRLQRTPYPFPMYCEKHTIGGLEQYKDLAASILIHAGGEPKTIVLWRIEGARLYGQCNFKMEQDAPNDLKFCDTLQTVSENLKALVQDFGARRLLFLEADLMEIMRKQLSDRRLPARCLLVDTKWIPRPRPSV